VRWRKASLVAAACALIGLGGEALAAPEPVGPDFRISEVGADGDAERDAEIGGVAHNSAANEYLVVWDADGLTTEEEVEIFGQRVSAAGTELGTDFRISATGTDGDPERDALNPAVTYDPAADEYMVVWQADGLATNDEEEIFGQRISAGGAKEGEPFRISNAGPDGDANRDATDPVIAYNSADNEFLVAWAADHLAAGEVEVFGQRLDPTGAQIPDASDFRISNVTAVEKERDAFRPAIAYNPTANQYLATWDGDGFGKEQLEIAGQLLSAAGGELGVDFRISEAGIDGDTSRIAQRSEIAYGKAPNEYMVVWHQDDVTDNEFEIYGQRVSATGVGQGEQFRISNVGEDEDAERSGFGAAVAYHSAADEFLVAWAGDGLATDNEAEIFGQRVSSSGVELGMDFRISRTGADGDPERSAVFPAIAYNPVVNEALVVWQADGLATDDETEVFGRRLAEPLPQSPQAISISGPAVVKCAGRAATQTGTSGRDLIKGTARRDVIAALAGKDTVRALGGNDLVCGGPGGDRLSGGKGRDTLQGESGGDTLNGGRGKDSLKGGRGRDTLDGGPGIDALAGGPGKDSQRQ